MKMSDCYSKEEKLEQRIARLEGALQGLVEYTEHKDTCNEYGCNPYDDGTGCDCGLAETRSNALAVLGEEGEG